MMNKMSRHDAADLLDNLIGMVDDSQGNDYDTALKMGIEALKADVQPVRHGHWVYGEDDHGIDGYHCNKCGFFVPWDYTHKFINFIEDYHYCPHCNARMDEVT